MMKHILPSRFSHYPLRRRIILVILGLILSLSIHTLPQVRAALPIPPENSPIALVQSGKNHYDAGQFSEAVQILQQAQQNYEASGDVLKQAQVLSLLSLSYQKLGQWDKAEEAINASLSLIETVPNGSDIVHAQVLNAQGNLQLATGNAEAALKTWQAAETFYKKVEDKVGILGSHINQAEAMQALGLYRRTEQLLAQVEEELLHLNDSPLKAKGLQNLGNVLRQKGDLDKSHKILTQSLAVTQELKSPQQESQVLLSLANTERTLARRSEVFKDKTAAKKYNQDAIKQYQESAKIATSPLTKIQAQLNQLSLLIEIEQLSNAKTIVPQIIAEVATLPVSRASVYAHVNLAESLMKMSLMSGDSSLVRSGADFCENTWRLEIAATQTKSAFADSIQPAEAGFVCVAPDFQSVGNLPDGDTPLAKGNSSLVIGKQQITNNKQQITNNKQPTTNNIPQILETAIKQAESLKDERAKSYSLGTLGKFYENTEDWKNGKNVTEKALLVAQQINASDIAYQWQWQLGRLLQDEAETISQNKEANPDAIAYYTAAFNTLKSLRSDIVSLNPEIQFSFRESVEPIYRQLVDLLLRSPTPPKENLIQARNVMEALQLAELDNFFRDACATPEAVNIDNVDKQAGIFYPIILENRLEVILKLPGEDNLHHYGNNGVSEAQVDEAVQELRIALTKRSSSISQVKKASKKIYDWLIKPFENELKNVSNSEGNRVKTLVFVLDGSLRNIPPATLYDGEKYLVEKYAIAMTPGLQLLEPKPLVAENIKVLIAGATNAPSFQKEKFTSLDNVEDELKEIGGELINSETLQNQNFLEENIQTQINSAPFNIVHIATHGKFSSNPQETFILDWNKRITVKDLDSLLRINNPTKATAIELLVLSACETAAGDKRAALGLAGIAIRAGAHSTLATLWQVNDASTAAFMLRFYQQLSNPEISKAEAIRNTQIAFMSEYPNTDYNRPYYWAPFILVGNWL
ncbi:CHAT domain-containing protein [Limnofasciculus baicalensis]|uniref:CHAT domain-containing protein n=1 Tax=Limnofasciculus baicalensis BBK-W-15 TaxID=2699891 RepID=A0AAE3GT06_9CYAN|nr:CHAT domain-containing protein [Limnofasciculus baicalensis]MCP2729432.1 CHAT domain-containing protein [Limnofasciculus baicalensis BBK-W-15]